MDIVLEGCISQYIRLLYWRDASHNTLGYCIEGMHVAVLYPVTSSVTVCSTCSLAFTSIK